MGVAIHDRARILRQRRVRRRRADRAPRYPTQHHEAFGYQIGVGVEFGRHGGEEGMQQDQVVALDIPAGLFDLGP